MDTLTVNESKVAFEDVMPEVKTYMLLAHTEATAPIYQRIDKDHRVRLTKRPVDHAYMKITFADEKGRNKTIRLKLSCDEIDQQVQIKDKNIPANEPFTDDEREAVKFTFGTNTTSNPTVQRFLEASPQYEGFKGTRPAGITALYALYDPMANIRNTNTDFRKRLAAGNKIAELKDLEEAQNLMIRLNGTHFTPPATLLECVNGLIDFLDDADDKMLDALLKEDKEVTKDEEVNILISRAILAGIISFDAEPNQVSKKRGEKWIAVKAISSEYDPSERQRYFAEYLATEDGKLLLNDIKKEVKTSLKKLSEKAD